MDLLLVRFIFFWFPFGFFLALVNISRAVFDGRLDSSSDGLIGAGDVSCISSDRLSGLREGAGTMMSGIMQVGSLRHRLEGVDEVIGIGGGIIESLIFLEL